MQGSDVDKSDDFAFHRIELRAPERFASPHGRSSQMSRPGQTSVIIKCTYEYRLVKRFCLSEQARTSRCRFIFSDQPSGNWRAPKPVLESSPILKFRPPSFTVLVMTRDALIALFDSTDSMEAGAVISFVMSLAYDDIRFETSFEGQCIMCKRNYLSMHEVIACPPHPSFSFLNERPYLDLPHAPPCTPCDAWNIILI